MCPSSEYNSSDHPSLAAELDSLTVESEDNLSNLEREKFEVLLKHALRDAQADYACVLSPAGQGAYAEQFVKLSALVERNAEGLLQSCHDSLANRRPDPMILSVMRLRRGVCGKPTDIGLPACLPGSHPTIRYFVMLPIAVSEAHTSVLFVANPRDVSAGQTGQELSNRLSVLVQTLAGRIDTTQPVAAHNTSVAGDDLGARHYIQLMSAAINAVVITDPMGKITAFNPSAERLFGCQSSRALGSRLNRYLPQEFLVPILKRATTFDASALASQSSFISQRSVAAVVESGQDVNLMCSAYFTQVGETVYTTFLFEHESESTPLLDASDSYQQFKALTNVAPVGIIQLAADWTCEYANMMWCQLSGLSVDESLNEGWVDAIHAEDVVDTLVDLREALSHNRIFSKDIRLQLPTGRISWVTLSATVTLNDAGHFSGCMLVLLDITEAHLAREKLRFAAGHDVLTGLANRSAFLDRLQERLNDDELRSKTALLYLDLDGFKAINDTLGHDCGDELLRQVATRLGDTVGSEDLCARLGGDEFTVIVASVDTTANISDLAERIVRRFGETFTVFDNELHMSTSIGIAQASSSVTDSDELIKQADTALYRAKASGRSRWMVYTREFQHEDRQRSVLQARVRRATECGEFELAYQPQYRVDDERIVGFEALLRWYPSDIPAPDTQTLINNLEDSGLISEVGQWVLESACQQFRSWDTAGLLPDGCTMSVNVSAAQLSLANFAPRLNVILRRYGMSPGSLNLEITESALIEENSNCIRVIKQIKELGVRLSLDDFGTGYASLSYLTRLPIDYLKIDRSFILDMQSDEPSRIIVMSVLAMAETLNIKVVAEGIEEQSTLDLLRKTNCLYVQGYLMCEPKPAQALEPMLVRNQYKRHQLIELV